MRLAIIISDNNKNLLKFTETKLFFNAKNKSTDFFDDCIIVENLQNLEKFKKIYESIFVLPNGYFLTTTFREKYKDYKGVYIIDENTEDVIMFDTTNDLSLSKKSHYEQGSKQLYILENLLKVLFKHKKLIYYDNTESYIKKDYKNIKNFYGLASGWKSYRIIRDIGIHNLENIVIFDYNPIQLEYAKNLHSLSYLPEKIEQIKNSCGNYDRPNDLIDFWKLWNNFPVKFEIINLFDEYKFMDNSLIWISNIFYYEPNIFYYGWEQCKKQKNNLILNNPFSIIIET